MDPEFILLPKRGVVATQQAARAVLSNLPRAISTGPSIKAMLQDGVQGAVEVIDSTLEIGPKLVRMEAAMAAAINATSTTLRALPVVKYGLPERAPRQVPKEFESGRLGPLASAGVGVAAPGPTTTFTIECRDKGSGAALPDCTVIAFANFAARQGAKGNTDAQGRATLKLAANTIDRLYVYSPETHWGAYRANLAIPAAGAIRIDIEKVSLSYVDAVRKYYGASRFQVGANVKVGVIDTGVGPHNHINLVAGVNTVTGEPANAYEDWFGHGTHVAGLIGSNSAPPAGLRGVAPGCAIYGYRVFGQNADGATNYAILKALIRAAADGCDIVNLSLGGGPADQIVEEAIADACNQGMLVVIAAGNDGRQPVSFPAAHPGATAVSAIGCDGTFPTGSVYDGDRLRPPTSQNFAGEFVAGFSNIGPEIAVAGLGVGVLSTLPNNLHGPMSGTSMAAPVVAGCAASLLSQNPAILAKPRNLARATAMQKMLQTNSVRRNFGPNFEGYGLPDPALV